MANMKTAPTSYTQEPDTLFLASRYGLRTYSDLHSFKKYFLQLLHSNDYDFKDSPPVGFHISSSDELIMALASCWELGIPFICYNPESTNQELKQQMNEIGPDLLFVEDEKLPVFPKSKQILKKELDIERALEFEHEKNAFAEKFEPETTPDRVFGYFYTSGTSGTPKTVPLKRRQVRYASQASAMKFKPSSNHFWLLCLPLHHIGGVSIILRSLLYGSAVYRMNNFDAEMVSTFLSENKLFEAASLVPTMLKRLMDIPAFQTHKAFKAILLGGGHAENRLIVEAAKKGIPIVSSYGMTETCAQIASNPILQPSGVYRPRKSVGTIFEPNEIEIRDEDGKRLSPNNPGTIWLKGPQVFDGYTDSQLNEEAFDNEGWFNTGDYGHLNGNGYLFIEGRRKDLIISGGENISPQEVEQELAKLNDIREAAVFGISDSEWGERVVAVIATESNNIDIDDIKKALKKKLTDYKIPKEIVTVDSLPKTSTGKVVKEKLYRHFHA